MSQSRLLSCLVPMEGCLLQFSVLLQSTESNSAFPGLCEEELWDHLQDTKEEKTSQSCRTRGGGGFPKAQLHRKIPRTLHQPGELLVCWG